MFISGKVVMDDGSPIPPNITIEKFCYGTPRPVAYTDSKGRFNFEWNRPMGVLPDASTPGYADAMGGMVGNPTGRTGGMNTGSSRGGFGSNAEREMNGCELRASLAGYRSDNINLASHKMFDNPDVGSIVLHRLSGVEGTSVSATSYNAPKDAKKAREKGLEALRKGKTADAVKELEKAVEIYPKYADAWHELGKARLAEQSPDTAREAFNKALEADSKLVGPYVELGLMSARQQNWTDAAQYLDRAVRLDPLDFPQAWFADAVANYNLKKYDVAEKSAREAQRLDPQHRNPRNDRLLGAILAEKHDYVGAAEQMRNYMKFAPQANDLDQVKQQLAQFEKLAQVNQP